MISDEEQGQTLIGEAAINLIFSKEEVTLTNLIGKLEEMRQAEIYPPRKAQMSESLLWLRRFDRIGITNSLLESLIHSPLRDALKNTGGIDIGVKTPSYSEKV